LAINIGSAFAFAFWGIVRGKDPYMPLKNFGGIND